MDDTSLYEAGGHTFVVESKRMSVMKLLIGPRRDMMIKRRAR